MKNYETWNEMYQETVPLEIREKIDFEVLLCNEIETIMKNEGISFPDLVKKSGLSRETVYKFLKLDTIPKIESLEKMANAMDHRISLIPEEDFTPTKICQEQKALTGNQDVFSWFQGFVSILNNAKNEQNVKISEVTGISHKTVKNILDGKTIPRVHTLRKIADAVRYKIAFVPNASRCE